MREGERKEKERNGKEVQFDSTVCLDMKKSIYEYGRVGWMDGWIQRNKKHILLLKQVGRKTKRKVGYTTRVGSNK